MDEKLTVLGIILVLVYWAFQAGYLGFLGTAAWFLAVLLFLIINYPIGSINMPKPSADQKLVWSYVYAFALIIALIVSFVPPSALGAVVPPGFQPWQLTSILLSFVLVLFGAAMFVGGQGLKESISPVTGIIWLFGAITFVLNAGANAYLHFGLITGLPFFIHGLLKK